MEYANHLNEYAPAWSEAQVAEEVARIREAAKRNHNAEVYKMCYSAIDITTLSCNDSVTSVTEFARKTAEFYQKFPHIPNVASICIYPAFVETVGLAVDGTPMKITSVGGGFPAAQTFLEVKALEVAMAIEKRRRRGGVPGTPAGQMGGHPLQLRPYHGLHRAGWRLRDFLRWPCPRSGWERPSGRRISESATASM